MKILPKKVQNIAKFVKTLRKCPKTFKFCPKWSTNGKFGIFGLLESYDARYVNQNCANYCIPLFTKIYLGHFVYRILLNH